MAERRVPPQNLDAEASVIGGVLLRADAIHQVERLTPEDFYDPRHAHVFRAMRELQAKNLPIDIITLEEQLKVMDKLTAIGGVSFIGELVSRVATTANIAYYATLVSEKATARKLIEAAAEIADKGYEYGEVKEYLDESEQKIFSITEQRGASSTQPIKRLLKQVFTNLDKRFENKGDVTGVPSGFTDLDQLTAGLQPSDLIIVAARPAMGKCVREGTLVPLADGRLSPIEDIVRGHAVARVMSLEVGPSFGEGDQTFRAADVSDWVDDGRKPCFKIKTALGREVETTWVHPFLTPEGWRQLGELNVGDRIAVVRRIEVFGALETSHARVRTLAAALSGAAGDGKGLGRALSAVAAEAATPEARARVGRVVTALQARRHSAAATARLARMGLRAASGGGGGGGGGGGETTSERAESREESRAAMLAAFGRNPSTSTSTSTSSGSSTGSSTSSGSSTGSGSGSSGPAAPDYFETVPGVVPDEVFSYRRELLAEYLRVVLGRGLLTAEGLRWPAPTEKAARQVAHLALRFGMVARVRPSRVHGGAPSLEIDDPASLLVLAREVGAEGLETKLARFERAWAQRLAHDDGHVSDIVFDRIVSIEPTGEHSVYDLTVPGTHNFVAGDVVVHNTSLVMSLAQNAAIGAGYPAIVFSLEMSSLQLVERMLCSEARIDSTLLRRGNLQRQDLSNLTVAASSISKAPIFIDDTPGPTVHELRSRARRWRGDKMAFGDKPFGLIIVDYLQLMKGSQQGSKNSNREQEISEISRGLKALAKELHCPVVALSQLNRGVEQRTDKRPLLSDLRESGAIEQDADVIMFIYRDEVYDKESKDKGIAEVIIGKQRNGPIDTVRLSFVGKFTRFENISSRRDEF